MNACPTESFWRDGSFGRRQNILEYGNVILKIIENIKICKNQALKNPL